MVWLEGSYITHHWEGFRVSDRGNAGNYTRKEDDHFQEEYLK